MWGMLPSGVWQAYESNPLLLLVSALVIVVATASLGRKLVSGHGHSPPYARSFPILGDTVRYVTDTYRLLSERHTRYGSVFTQSVFFMTVVQVSDVDAVRKLLASEHNLVESNFTASVELTLGPGAITNTYGAEHLKLRKALNPAFSPGKIAEYLPSMVAICQECVDRWIQLGNFKGKTEISAFAFKVAVKVILGFDNSWLEEAKLRETQEQFEVWTAALLSFMPAWLRFVPGTGFYKGMKARKWLLDAITQNLEKLENELQNPQLSKGKREANIAQTLIGLRDDEGIKLDTAALKDQALNVLWAGHETTAQCMLLMLQRLKQHPAVLAKLREEQEQVEAQHGEDLTDAVLKDMAYAEAVIKETLRIHPIVGAVLRKALKDFEIGPYSIRKGDLVWLQIGRIMREVDERWAGTSDFPLSEFHPERWQTKEGSIAGAWMPFGAGVRMCLGMNLAFAEMKVLLALLARRCDWQLEDVNEPVIAFPIPRPANDLPLKMWELKKG